MGSPTKSIRSYQSDLDFPELDDDVEMPQLIKQYNELVKGINFLNKFLSFQSNFDGFIATNISIPATSSVKIQHFLGVIPKWRIILRQEGNGVITDVYSQWNTDTISLFNNGAVTVIITVFIARE